MNNMFIKSERTQNFEPISKSLTADAIIDPATPCQPARTTERIVMIGASTGGAEALHALLSKLPGESPGIIIVQHMPEQFTSSFARRLNRRSEMVVKEAEENDSVIRGQALIAPGNRHVLLQRRGGVYHVTLHAGSPVRRHRPSVDVLFRSASLCAGKNALGILMTGMGDDGAAGLLEMKNAGARTIAQDEASCVVFGMPREAIERHAVTAVVTLNTIPLEIISWNQGSSNAASE